MQENILKIVEQAYRKGLNDAKGLNDIGHLLITSQIVAIELLNKIDTNKWILTDEKLPHCYQIGDWDGYKSDTFIGETINGDKFLGRCYQGIMDGSEYFDWYLISELNKTEWLLCDKVHRWFPIPL